MTQALKTTTAGGVLRPLRVLATLIQEDLKHAMEAAEEAARPFYHAVGEKLIEARQQMPHGEFREWAQRVTKRGDSQISYYMKLARQNAATEAFPTVSAMRQATEPSHANYGRPLWNEPVKKIIDRVDTETLNLKREELKRDEERDAQRKLALQLIDIGYKVLARTLHPDKGGSREAMTRLNAVRDRLKHCI